MTTSRSNAALSLARRAGKLTIGSTATQKAISSKQAKLIVFASDVSPRTFRNFTRILGDIPYVTLGVDQDELEVTMKRRFAVAAITDSNFKDLFLKSLKEGT